MSRLKDFIDEFQRDILDLHGLRLLDPVEQYIDSDGGRYSIYANIRTKDGERTVKLQDTGYFFDEGADDSGNFWNMADFMRADTTEQREKIFIRMKKANLFRNPNWQSVFLTENND